jgi:hypothetical protein
MSMADTTQQTPREILAHARERNAHLQTKGRAAQAIGRSLADAAFNDNPPSPGDISTALIRLLGLTKDLMALSTEVVEACEGALVASHE